MDIIHPFAVVIVGPDVASDLFLLVRDYRRFSYGIGSIPVGTCMSYPFHLLTAVL